MIKLSSCLHIHVYVVVIQAWLEEGRNIKINEFPNVE